MTHGAWKGPSNIVPKGVSVITTECENPADDKSAIGLRPRQSRTQRLGRQVAAAQVSWPVQLQQQLHSHRMLYSHAIHAMRGGVDVYPAEQVDHSSSATTGHYVAATIKTAILCVLAYLGITL